MVSFEVRKRAECLISQVASIELANQGIQEYQQKLISRKGSSSYLRQGIHQFARATSSMQVSNPQPLADDLSSTVSESDISLVERDDNFLVEYNFDLAEWREQFLYVGDDKEAILEVCDSAMRCKLAMHQILVNSDLKVRKLQYELLMIRRLFEDAQFSIECYKNKIDALERQLLVEPQPQNNSKIDAHHTFDLTVENHLNKLLISRNKALDENLKMKKQLLSCCSKCREQMMDPIGKNLSPEPKKTQHLTPSHRPTFQKTACDMVKRIGQRTAASTQAVPGKTGEI